MILLSNHLIQTFTPPTCTLKIWDKRSLALRLQKPILLDDIEFKLSFDDPKVMVEDQISISGNHFHLKSLCDIVQSYINNNLKNTFSFIDPRNNQNKLIKISEKKLEEDIYKLDPYFCSDDLFTHNLFLGYLANNNTCSSIKLNSCQLFDLLYALEKYIHNITTLTSQKKVFFNNQFFTLSKKLIIAFIFTNFFIIGIKINKTLESKHTDTEKLVKSQENILSFLDVVPPVPPELKPSSPSPSLPPSLSQLSPLPPPKKITQSLLPLNKSNPPKFQSSPSNLSSKSSRPQINENDAKISGNVNYLAQPQVSSKYSRLPTPPILNRKTFVREKNINKENTSDHLLALEDKNLNKYNMENKLSITIPQLDEIQEYFQKRWKPLENLEQTIEYRLIIENNGSFKKSIPLGHLAMVYRSQIEFPEAGSPFVSPLKTLNSQSIRLVLIPDGTVKTLLE